MISAQDAFIDAWRSYRVREGDDPSSLPDPLRISGNRSPKKATRKTKDRSTIGSASHLDEDSQGNSGGGFLVDEGPTEGGFIVDEEQNDSGGFLSAEENVHSDTEGYQLPTWLPIAYIPDALANLSLPSTDQAVLKLFSDVAIRQSEAESEGLSESNRRRRRGGATDKVVLLQDFERVVEVLHEGQRQDDTHLAKAESSKRSSRPRRAAAAVSALKRRRDEESDIDLDEEDDSEGDVYRDAGVDDDEERSDREDDHQDTLRPRRTKSQKTKSQASNRKKDGSESAPKSASGGLRRARRHVAASEEDDTSTSEESSHDTNLTRQQKARVQAAYDLVVNRLEQLQSEAGEQAREEDRNNIRLSVDDVRKLVKSVGEKIPEREVREYPRNFSVTRSDVLLDRRNGPRGPPVLCTNVFTRRHTAVGQIET